MSSIQFEAEKEHIITKLKEGYYLKNSSNEMKIKLVTESHIPVEYYSIRLLNNLLDEKIVINSAGKYILTNQNF